jgi:threonine/homoserine/homoserine lactone efflux protein
MDETVAAVKAGSMYFLPDTNALLQFTAAAVMLTITPGPDMTLFLSRAISHGRAAGLVCMLGASTGVLFHTLLAAVGLSALLAASPTAFTMVKFAGAGYLLFLGYQAIRHGSALNVETGKTAKPTSLWRHYLTGIGINLMNPKIVLFFVSFLPLFISADDPHAAEKLAFFGVFFLVIAIPMVIPMILAADWMADALKRNRRAARTMDYLFASVFGAFAIKILADR